MATELKRDFTIYSDLDLTLEVNPFTGDISKITDDRAVKRSLCHLLLYEKWDVPFESDIHGHVKELLFESPDQIIIQTLKERVAWVIKAYEKRVKLHEVVVDVTPDEAGFYITVNYEVVNLNLEDSFKFFLERVR